MLLISVFRNYSKSVTGPLKSFLHMGWIVTDHLSQSVTAVFESQYEYFSQD